MRYALRTIGLTGLLMVNGAAMVTAYRQSCTPTPQERFITNMMGMAASEPQTMEELIRGISEARPTKEEGKLYLYLLSRVLTYTDIELRTCTGDERMALYLQSFLTHEKDRLRQWQYSSAEEFFIRVSIESALSNLDHHLAKHTQPTRTSP